MTISTYLWKRRHVHCQ